MNYKIKKYVNILVIIIKLIKKLKELDCLKILFFKINTYLVLEIYRYLSIKIKIIIIMVIAKQKNIIVLLMSFHKHLKIYKKLIFRQKTISSFLCVILRTVLKN
jgi:hypothetical protein